MSNNNEEEKEKKESTQLSIFLIKKGVSKKNIIEDGDHKSHKIEIPDCKDCTIYIKKSGGIAPQWSSFFEDINIKSENNDPRGKKRSKKKHVPRKKITDFLGIKSDVSAALIIKLKILDKESGKKSNRYFALTFGHGGRYLLKNDAYTYRFGLFVTLKSIEKSSIRCIDKKSLGTIQSHARTQSGKDTTIDRFGIDIEQDMLKSIVGTPEDSSLGSRMTGTDSLSVTVKINKNLSNLASLLSNYVEQYTKDLRDEYKWVENISMVENSSDIDSLNKKLLIRFNKIFSKKNYSKSKLQLKIPEIIQWDKVIGFRFRDNNEHPKLDINLEDFLSTARKIPEIKLRFLKNRKVFCVYNEDDCHPKSWSIFKCIYFETSLRKGSKYILSDGNWFKVYNKFVDNTDNYFNEIDRSSAEKLGWPKYEGEPEYKYNSRVVKKSQGKYILLDRKMISHGNIPGKIEVCDLLSKNKHLIHVKIGRSSSVLSHLISQGYVSGRLLQRDSEFRRKVEQKLRKGSHKGLIKENSKPGNNGFTIVYAIIKDPKGRDLFVPFFSRVNINNAVKDLLSFGYKVQLLNIGYTDTSKKNAAQPKK